MKETIVIQYAKLGTQTIDVYTYTISKCGFLLPFDVVIPA
ncbi:hypothetical protein SPONL_199 [uncultured Candidatus Thioglobus sp.]|nr:hypothetical protein SPONL_199 [uncultured Candidatus Thioglobus sp.]